MRRFASSRYLSAQSPAWASGWSQHLYIIYRSLRAKDDLRKGQYTHAGGVVRRMRNGVLEYLLMRPKDALDEWVLPKGHIEEDEGHGETALREVLEETGIVARLICLVDRVRFNARGEDINAKFYLMEPLFNGIGSENRLTKWLPLDHALALVQHPETKHILQAAESKEGCG